MQSTKFNSSYFFFKYLSCKSLLWNVFLDIDLWKIFPEFFHFPNFSFWWLGAVHQNPPRPDFYPLLTLLVSYEVLPWSSVISTYNLITKTKFIVSPKRLSEKEFSFCWDKKIQVNFFFIRKFWRQDYRTKYEGMFYGSIRINPSFGFGGHDIWLCPYQYRKLNCCVKTNVKNSWIKNKYFFTPSLSSCNDVSKKSVLISKLC